MEKRDFSEAARHEAAQTGAAMPDGSFPIYNKKDLANARRLAGHASDPGKARAHISSRARALGLKDPYKEGSSVSEGKSIGNPYDSPYVRDILEPQKSRHQLAAGHPDLRQSNPDGREALSRVTTVLGDIECRGMTQDLHHGAAMSYAGDIALQRLDAAGQAGGHGVVHPSGDPLRPDFHTSRLSGTPANGSHGLSDAESTAVANKHAFLDAIRAQARAAGR